MARKKRNEPTPKKPFFEDLTPHARQAIWAVVMAVFAIFFLFSLLGFAGPVGHYSEVALRYLFGTGAWLAPLVCSVYIYVLLNPKEEDNEISYSKVTGTILLFVSLLAAFHLYQADLGGVVGYVLAAPLAYLIGSAVAGVLIFGLVLISTFLLFNTGLKMPFIGRLAVIPDDNSDIENLKLRWKRRVKMVTTLQFRLYRRCHKRWLSSARYGPVRLLSKTLVVPISLLPSHF